MDFSSLHFFPLAAPFLFGFFLLFIMLIVLVQVGILGYAYEKIGIRREYVFVLLFLSLLGSYINIPITELGPEKVVSYREIYFFGMRYVVPVVEERPHTVLAVNLGGAVIPTLVSLYLLVKNELYWRGFVATGLVTLFVYWLAQPVPGMGISVPVLLPPVAAALTALLFGRAKAPPLAYIAGSLGTLIGADLLNLQQMQGLGSVLASIGGAGTFDAIFLTGIIAVLLA